MRTMLARIVEWSNVLYNTRHFSRSEWVRKHLELADEFIKDTVNELTDDVGWQLVEQGLLVLWQWRRHVRLTLISNNNIH